jgi:hypothetical protein
MTRKGEIQREAWYEVQRVANGMNWVLWEQCRYDTDDGRTRLPARYKAIRAAKACRAHFGAGVEVRVLHCERVA